MGIKKIINKDVTKDFDFLCFYLRQCLRGSNRDTWRPRALVLFSSLTSFPRHLICKSIKRRSVGKCSVPAQCYGSGSSSRKVSHQWLDTLWEDNNTNNRNNGPSHKRITAANKQKNIKFTRAPTFLFPKLFTSFYIGVEPRRETNWNRVLVRITLCAWPKCHQFSEEILQTRTRKATMYFLQPRSAEKS